VTSGDEETELMLRVAAGDEEAFVVLVGRVLPRLVGYFRKLGADRGTAEDCAQETLVKVYRVRARYEPRARFLTYLFHVARNHWIDVYRHRKVGPQQLAADALPDDERPAAYDPPAPAEDPGARLAREELSTALRAAIQSLGDEHREVFVLSQVDGLRYEAIGEILGIPLGTVKSRMFAAVRQVREALLRKGIEP
jgi:RNA polymerase sigma-70 factor (ECF subfamily)